MKIDHVEVVNLWFEYPGGMGFDSAGGPTTSRVTSLIFVHTDTQHVGLGSAYSHPALVHLVIKQQLEPLLVGEDPREVESLWSLT